MGMSWVGLGMLAADRIAAALPDGLRRRALGVEGGEAIEIDGLVVGLTNIPTPELNTVGVVREPADPAAALAASEEAFRSRGHSFFGIELEPGRFPGVDSAVRAAGLVRVISRPAMAVEIGSLPDLPDPPGVTIARIRDRAALEDLRRIDAEAFGTAPYRPRSSTSAGSRWMRAGSSTPATATKRSAVRRRGSSRGPSACSACASWRKHGAGGSGQRSPSGQPRPSATLPIWRG